MLRPVSVKRPHWVMLGFERPLSRPGVQGHAVLGTPLVSFSTAAGELRVAERACPHRGASLARGAVDGRCVVCPYHGKHIGVETHPRSFYDYAALQGLVWVDVAKDLFTQHHMPPYFPDLATFKTTDFTKTLRVNPLALVEHLVDALSRAARPTHVQYYPDDPCGSATYAFQTAYGVAIVEHEFHVPYTVRTRVKLGGDVAIAAMASVQPESRDACKLHIRIARPAASDKPWAAWALRVGRLVTQLVLVQAATTVAGVDVGRWGSGALDDEDEFLALYRRSLRASFPELVEYFGGGSRRD